MTFDFFDMVGGILFLLVVSDLLAGIRATAISGFKFYLIPLLLYTLPICLAALVIVAGPPTLEIYAIILLVGASFLFVAARAWVSNRQNKARETSPDRWHVWEERLRQASRLDKVLVYPVVPHIEQINSDVTAINVSVLQTLTRILRVALVVGILVVIFLLLRRG